MSRLALLVVLLALAGCGEVARCWNPGGVPRITVTSPVEVHAEGIRRGAPCPAGSYVQAWYDADAQELRLPDGVPRHLLVALAYHELGEAIARTDPGIWRYLNAIASPTFPCGEDAHRTGLPAALAAASALAEAARARAAMEAP